MGRVAEPPALRFARFLRPDGDCWIWTGGTTNSGYGKFRIGTRTLLVHRWIYQHMVADIPDGLTIDHLCGKRLCQNPWHMDPVPSRVNALRSSSPAAENARKQHCPRGHAYDMALVGNRRWCRRCHNAERARNRAKRSAA